MNQRICRLSGKLSSVIYISIVLESLGTPACFDLFQSPILYPSTSHSFPASIRDRHFRSCHRSQVWSFIISNTFIKMVSSVTVLRTLLLVAGATSAAATPMALGSPGHLEVLAMRASTTVDPNAVTNVDCIDPNVYVLKLPKFVL